MRFLFGILFLFGFQLLVGQSSQQIKLANNYFRDAEYAKAAEIYGQFVTSRNNLGDYYFGRYLECLIALDQTDKAKSVVKKKMKENKNAPQFYIYLGNILEKEGKLEKAEKEYDKAIESLTPNHAIVARVASTFTSYNKTERAIETYLKANKLMKDDSFFATKLGDLYQREGDNSRMIEYYLKGMGKSRNAVDNLKLKFSRYLTEEDYLDLSQQLYIQIQDHPDELAYLELLEWVHIQNKDYKNALRQAKAIDRRSGGQGGRVYEMAKVASNARDYEAAISAYEYITKELGPNSPFYFDAQKEALFAKKEKIVRGRKYDESELLELRSDYNQFIEEWGKTPQTASMMAQWANLEARHLDDIDAAIRILKDLIDIPNVNRYVFNSAKLDLGDAYLIKGDIWEATLLYGQVDKEFREDYLGEKARYRNARLYYYNGDFEWAQAQFDILKAATSRLISNDAIDQSVFIMDNLGLDTTPVPLQMYARAELLQFQNQYDRAFATLDSITTVFPGHTLEDDIWYLKANVYKRRKDFDQAINYYNLIIDQYPEDIRADNALFELAQVYEINLNQPEKAMELYEKLFIDYSGSTLAVEARKTFRQLRGDDVVQ